MHCPFCHNPNSRVVDTRVADDGLSIRRRRECTACKRRFTTLETSAFQVVKRSGAVEPFSLEKVAAGVRRACQGRPVSEQDLELLAQQVEEKLRSTGVSTVSSEEVGQTVLPYLSDLDEIAYLRFASVYRNFRTLSDFEEAIVHLRQQKDDKSNTDQADNKAEASVAKPKGVTAQASQSATGSKNLAAGSSSPVARPEAVTREKPVVKKAGSKRKRREEEPTLLDVNKE